MREVRVCEEVHFHFLYPRASYFSLNLDERLPAAASESRPKLKDGPGRQSAISPIQ